MNTNVDPRITRGANASKQDLRVWLAEMEAAGEVTHISGAEREREIGGIVDIYQRKIGNPAVLFDDIPGYPKGHRILANILTSNRRINMTMGNPADGSEIELVKHWRKYMKEAKTFPPVEVKNGALLENVKTGDDIDLFKIPVPQWHEHDGGYYIGTGDMVVMKDPDTGWINYGAYRVQAHDKKLATVMCSKGKHGDMIQKQISRARAAVPGRGGVRHASGAVHDRRAGNPARQERIRRGRRAARRAGGGDHGAEDRPADPGARRDRVRGLHPSERQLDEGPLGEWTGYYAGGLKKEPAIRIETMMYRDNPILLGAIPGIPPDDNSFYRGSYRSGAVWNQLEAAGVPEVRGVWSHAAGGSRLWLTVSIKQMYAGHSKQAGLIASQCHAGAYVNRFVVVVDEDINPADMDKVIWAMCTRFDPREGMEVLRGCWSSALDPMAYSEKDPRNARVVIDACKPFGRRDTFPREVRASPEVETLVRGKFGELLPK